MGDPRNKARSEADKVAVADADRRRRDGWTVFHFDFNPRLTLRNLTIGDAIRALQRVTGTKISFWRCPVRGLSIQYRELPRSSYAFDGGVEYRFAVFSRQQDVAQAKRELVMDALLHGINLYRALPNAVFDEQVMLLRSLLTAPPSLAAGEWNAMKARLHDKARSVIETHQPELRHHLLGERSEGLHTGTVAIGVKVRRA